MQQNPNTINLDVMAHAVAYQTTLSQLLLTKLYSSLQETFTLGTILDFGSGLGHYAKQVAEQCKPYPVVCLEPDAAIAPPNAKGLLTIRALSEIPEHSLVAAYSLNVLEHIPNDIEALTELTKRVRPGGHVFLLVPAHQWLWTAMDTKVGHQRRYSLKELQAVASSAGLTIKESGWFDRTGFFVTIALKLAIALGLRKRTWDGVIAKDEVLKFDALFAKAEPWLSKLPIGKNCWVLASKAIPN